MIEGHRDHGCQSDTDLNIVVGLLEVGADGDYSLWVGHLQLKVGVYSMASNFGKHGHPRNEWYVPG
jgi:hypothetical protein